MSYAHTITKDSIIACDFNISSDDECSHFDRVEFMHQCTNYNVSLFTLLKIVDTHCYDGCCFNISQFNVFIIVSINKLKANAHLC